uniref:Putative secreted peptide n=1 Tax=Anopheles braziliensis TaxID=58242 RepID=A0A2M3ZW68_9DIPT
MRASVCLLSLSIPLPPHTSNPNLNLDQPRYRSMPRSLRRPSEETQRSPTKSSSSSSPNNNHRGAVPTTTA